MRLCYIINVKEAKRILAFLGAVEEMNIRKRKTMTPESETKL